MSDEKPKRRWDDPEYDPVEDAEEEGASEAAGGETPVPEVAEPVPPVPATDPWSPLEEDTPGCVGDCLGCDAPQVPEVAPEPAPTPEPEAAPKPKRTRKPRGTHKVAPDATNAGYITSRFAAEELAKATGKRIDPARITGWVKKGWLAIMPVNKRCAGCPCVPVTRESVLVREQEINAKELARVEAEVPELAAEGGEER